MRIQHRQPCLCCQGAAEAWCLYRRSGPGIPWSSAQRMGARGCFRAAKLLLEPLPFFLNDSLVARGDQAGVSLLKLFPRVGPRRPLGHHTP